MTKERKLGYLVGLEPQFFGGNGYSGVPYTPSEDGMPDPYRRMHALTSAAREDDDPDVRRMGWQMFDQMLDRMSSEPRR